jgi:hypothetical protein
MRLPAASLSVLALLLAGCTGAPSAPPAEPLQTGQEPPGGPNATAPAPGPGNASAPAANRSFPPQEHDLQVTAYAATPAGDTGNMNDATWQVDVPAGATTVKATAAFHATSQLGEMMLMIHLGTLQEPGDMLTAVNGASPLATDTVAVPPGVTTLLVMCHVGGDPASAEVVADAHLTAEFA